MDNRAHPLLRFIISFCDVIVIEIGMFLKIERSGKLPAGAFSLSLIFYIAIIHQSHVQFKVAFTYVFRQRRSICALPENLAVRKILHNDGTHVEFYHCLQRKSSSATTVYSNAS